MSIAQSAGKKCSLNSRCRVVEKTSSIHCSLLKERDVLPVQDAERLLERLDLLLAARHAVLVAHASVHARPVPCPQHRPLEFSRSRVYTLHYAEFHYKQRSPAASLKPSKLLSSAESTRKSGRLELVVVRKSRVELLLRALQVRLLRGQSSLLVGLLRRLVLHVLRVRGAVHRRLASELVERLLRFGLGSLRVRLETGEVRLRASSCLNQTLDDSFSAVSTPILTTK